MWVRSLGQEYPLEQEMATHANILAWKIPWAEEPDHLYIVHGDVKELDMTEHTHRNTHQNVNGYMRQCRQSRAWCLTCAQ